MLKKTIKWQHDCRRTAHFHDLACAAPSALFSLPLVLSLSRLLIDSHSIERAATVLQENAVVNYVLMNRAYLVK